ncbi:MAG: filamentous hemagglutinin N-terminal domain-containing protein [Leptolyngbyaceae cyanobacterium bins.349]|nr:filamentous hemagglutinin N-terminal domain-containing protein [Leptolyngbyaceae cyanobacterium bins.349]
MANRRVRMWARSSLVGCLLGFSGSLLLPSVTQAQIQADPTLGTVATPFTPGACAEAGGICDITNGTARGANLFHSFRQFSLPNGDRASFITDPAIQNVIVRVTGVGQPFISNINGTIETLDPAFNPVSRNFFLLNPNGIVFGPGARLLIGGSFLATTAERMLFQDGTVFNTHDRTVAPLLTVSVPVGLQIGQLPADIQMRGSRLLSGTRDNFADFALIGGNILLLGYKARIVILQRMHSRAVVGELTLQRRASLACSFGLKRHHLATLLPVRLLVRVELCH